MFVVFWESYDQKTFCLESLKHLIVVSKYSVSQLPLAQLAVSSWKNENCKDRLFRFISNASNYALTVNSPNIESPSGSSCIAAWNTFAYSGNRDGETLLFNLWVLAACDLLVTQSCVYRVSVRPADRDVRATTDVPACQTNQRHQYHVAKYEQVTVPCQVDANPASVQFQWKLNNSAEFVQIASDRSGVLRGPRRASLAGWFIWWHLNES